MQLQALSEVTNRTHRSRFSKVKPFFHPLSLCFHLSALIFLLIFTPSYSNTRVCAYLPLIRWITLNSSAVGEDEAIGWGVRAVSQGLVFLWRLPPQSSCSACVYLNLDLKHLTGCQEAVYLFIKYISIFDLWLAFRALCMKQITLMLLIVCVCVCVCVVLINMS